MSLIPDCSKCKTKSHKVVSTVHFPAFLSTRMISHEVRKEDTSNLLSSAKTYTCTGIRKRALNSKECLVSRTKWQNPDEHLDKEVY